MFKSVNVLRLGKGKQVITELSKYCQRKNISSAIIFGMMGSLQKVKIPKFCLETNKVTGTYDEWVGPFAVTGQGSISVFQNERKIHIHGEFAKYETGEAMGGHLAEAEVLNTLEIYIGELSYELKVEIDPKIGRPVIVST